MDFSSYEDTEKIATVLGSPIANVSANWHTIVNDLATVGYVSDNQKIAVLATIKIECPLFIPQKENGTQDYFIKNYWLKQNVAKMLGNTCSDDAVKFCGRGYIQITGKWNYQHFSTKLKIDLISNPDLALKPEIASKILVNFWQEHKSGQYAEIADWVKVRKSINGGVNGLSNFLRCIGALQALKK